MSKRDISLATDAYERLNNARQEGESFSEVIKRFIPEQSPHTQSPTHDSSTEATWETTPPENCSGASDVRGRVYIDLYHDH